MIRFRKASFIAAGESEGRGEIAASDCCDWKLFFRNVVDRELDWGQRNMNQFIDTEIRPVGSNDASASSKLESREAGRTLAQDFPQTQLNQPYELEATRTVLPDPATRPLLNQTDNSIEASTNDTAFEIDVAKTRLLSEKGIDSNCSTNNAVKTNPVLNPNKTKYEYVSEIAQGGMGRIVAVRDRSLRRKVAMKLLITPNGKPMRQQVNRLLAEAQTTGQLEHPNIVPIHDVGVYQDNKYYFTMKLVKGKTLKDVFRTLDKKDEEVTEQYSLPRLLALFQQIANGLGFAHSRGVIHRDLKPDNIMIGEFGEVLIMDWGIAKLVQQRSEADPADAQGKDLFADDFTEIDSQNKERTVVGTIAGTVGYMSPEQARGEIDKLDARTDIFSLGAMLYEMLAGSPPYNQNTVKERLHAAAAEEPIDPPLARGRKTNSKRVTTIPREVAAIAMKAIAPKATDRYQSAQEFFDDIQRYLEGHSVKACPDTVLQLTTKWIKRNRVMVRFVVAIVFAVLLTVFGARFLIRRSTIAGYTNEAQRIIASAETEREKQMQIIAQASGGDDIYADVNKQRGLDSIDEKYAAQLGQAADYYSRVFEYDPKNKDAHSALAKIYMEMWRSAQRRNKPELMTAYAQDVARNAGLSDYKSLYKAEIDGDGKFKLGASGVAAEVFIFKYIETGKWNRLTPVPYSFGERKTDDAAFTEAASKLRQGINGHDGSSIYFLNLDSDYGHHLGQTPLTLPQMPAGSYLFVLRAPGFEDLHLPVTVPRQKDLELNVKMLKKGERPAGFSYIPSVWAKLGGPAAGSKWPNSVWKSVNPFFIQTYEVTFGEYEEFLKGLIAEDQLAEAKKHLPQDFGFYYLKIVGKQLSPHSSLSEGWRKWPVRGVSWLDAQAYAQWRSRRDGITYRLPTEIEWEVAARGTDGRRYTWGELFWPQAARLRQGYSSAVNSAWDTREFSDESVFGVWDLTGSQAEWCADEFAGRPGEFVLRGNAWALQPVGLETAFRTSGAPDYFHATTAFRLAMSLESDSSPQKVPNLVGPKSIPSDMLR
jgi:eukaryotic-like serine/threonine-protein kinase